MTTVTPETLTDEFVAKTDARLEELAPVKAEYDQLIDLRARLTGTSTSKATPRRPTPSTLQPAGSGTRAQQFLDAVRAKPGSKVSEIARVMGVAPTYLYRLRTEAEDRGEIRSEDKKLYPV